MSEFYPQAFFDELIALMDKYGATWLGSSDGPAYVDTNRGRYEFTVDLECGDREVEFRHINQMKTYRPKDESK